LTLAFLWEFFNIFCKPAADGRPEGNVFAWLSNCTLRVSAHVGKFICELAGKRKRLAAAKGIGLSDGFKMLRNSIFFLQRGLSVTGNSNGAFLY